MDVSRFSDGVSLIVKNVPCVPPRGSHRQYKHLIKSGVVTVSGKPSDELASGTQNSIFKQAGYKK